MKIAVGTVQFGIDYGIANNTGCVPRNIVSRLLTKAKQLGVDTLDTAAGYGKSEKVLGSVGVESFKVVTKTPSTNFCLEAPQKWVEESVFASLQNLESKFLHGLLLHRPLELLTPQGEALYDGLDRMKRQGVVKNIGISISDPAELDRLSDFDFDIVQAPLNIFDRRLETSGWLQKLNRQNVQVHVRSAFLQGLLLMPPSTRPNYFNPWLAHFEKYDNWVQSLSCSAIEACIGFLRHKEEIDKIIVGVTSEDQLCEILAAANSIKVNPPDFLATEDKNLIDPSNWQTT